MQIFCVCHFTTINLHLLFKDVFRFNMAFHLTYSLKSGRSSHLPICNLSVLTLPNENLLSPLKKVLWLELMLITHMVDYSDESMTRFGSAISQKTNQPTTTNKHFLFFFCFDLPMHVLRYLLVVLTAIKI